MRWPLAPQKIIEDKFYPENALLNLCYHEAFVDEIIAISKDLKELFQLRKFNASESKENIFFRMVEFLSVKKAPEIFVTRARCLETV
ncbi:MAG: hypothetical protein KC505_09240 [Myxococcales bacterium]|nr:hypothetical protein [Myxococcales bacterium]